MDSIALMPFLMSLFLSPTIFLNTFSSYASLLTYTDHCASMVPNTTPNESKFKVFPLGELQVGYYLGGSDDSLRNRKQKLVTLRIKNVYETNVSGILNVGAMLMVPSAATYYHVNGGNSTHANIWHCKRSSIRFSLDGFWSESSGKLCMIGSEIGECLEHLEIVLKLYNVVNLSNTISTLVTGRFESLSPKHEVSYFEPISLFIFPRMGYDYEYTLDTEEAKNESSDEGGLVPGLAINLIRLCSNIYPMINGIYDLQYHSDCYSEKNCSPLWGDSRQLPYIVSLEGMVCSDVKQRVKVLIGFGNIDSGYRWSFNPNATLVGEGWWDERKNQLHVIACRFLGVEESVASVHVGDCSTRMSLRIPKIWSINDASSIVGQIWSNKTVGDAGYYKRIILTSHQDKRTRVSGIKYEYTKLEKLRKLCPRQEPLKNKGIRYPYVNSSDMRIEFSVGYSDQILAWGYCDPLVINDEIQQKNLYENFVPKSSHTQPFISANSSSTYLYNISYQISFSLVPDAKLGEENSIFNTTENATETINVSAEGVYDVEAGSLCMVGCRNLGSENKMPTTASVDCEILVKFQFLPPNAKNNGCYNIKGSMESNRKISDPLYFKPLDLFSVAFYTTEAKQVLRKIDFEVIMILLCTTLTCVFVGLQLRHMKRNPDMSPLVSFVMLLILTLHNMISLVLNFDSLLAQNHEKKDILLGNEWLELNEIAVRLIVMVTFLLQLRLLQLIWSARKGDRNQKGLWIAEKKVLYVIFPLYAAGLLIALLVHQNNTLQGNMVPSPSFSNYQKHLLWKELKSYFGLVLDGFLLPQILLNIFWNSKGNALCCSFYFGTSLVRLLPHAYDDLYKDLMYVVGSSFYEEEVLEYYSITCNIIIPLIVLVFAVIIYVQQRFGGCSIFLL